MHAILYDNILCDMAEPDSEGNPVLQEGELESGVRPLCDFRFLLLQMHTAKFLARCELALVHALDSVTE